MSTHDTFALIRTCLQDALKLTPDEAAHITEESTPVQFAQWTSAAHLELLLSLERESGVMFEADELAVLASVKAIRASLDKKLGR